MLIAHEYGSTAATYAHRDRNQQINLNPKVITTPIFTVEENECE